MSGDELDVRLEDLSGDLLALLQTPDPVASPDAVLELDLGEAQDVLAEESAELADVSRRISGQYAEVLARFAARTFAGKRDAAGLEQVRASITSLQRLAEATGDTSRGELLARLARIVDDLDGTPMRSRRRRHALAHLRDWIPAFAETLSSADAERLRRLVEWEEGEAPLLDELRNLYGIGPKRLARLYAAGLFTVEIVANAEPEDVVSVTGLPAPLARDVVIATREYADRERRRCVRILRERSVRLTNIVRATSMSDDEDLRAEVLEALRDVQAAFHNLTREDPT